MSRRAPRSGGPPTAGAAARPACAPRARGAALVALVALAACGDGPPPPADVLRLEVVLGARTVEAGRSVDLTVTRSWRADLVPEPFDERSLAPLTLRLEGTRRREGGGHVEETRRYRAVGFVPGPLSLPAPTLTARHPDGGAPRTVAAAPLSLTVTPVLDPAAPGDPERPTLPDAPSPPWGPLAGGLGLALAVAVGIVRRRRRGTAGPGPTPPVVAAPAAAADPAAVARAAVAALAVGARGDAAARCAAVAAAAAAVRGYTDARFAVGAEHRTTAELLAAPTLAALAPAARAPLASLLSAADLVKFAERVPDAAEALRALADADGFVAATSPAPEGP